MNRYQKIQLLKDIRAGKKNVFSDDQKTYEVTMWRDSVSKPGYVETFNERPGLQRQEMKRTDFEKNISKKAITLNIT